MCTLSRPLGAVLVLSILGGVGTSTAARDETLPAYAAISGTAIADSMSVSGPAVLEETARVPYAYAEGYDAIISLRADDPRLSGTYETTQDYIQFAPGREGGFVRAGRGRITNDGGSWLTEFRGFTLPGSDPVSGNTYFTLYTGVDGYAGLSAVTVWQPTGMGRWAFEGVLYPGALPDLPPPLAPTE